MVIVNTYHTYSPSPISQLALSTTTFAEDHLQSRDTYIKISTMPPKAVFRQAPEAILPQMLQNVGARTIYGDARMATEDALMAEHAKHLRLVGVIDDDMEYALSQPRFDKARELKTKFTTEYLAMHPSYTGSNVDEIPSYEVALRRQNARDAAQKKLLADYGAGKIGEHGYPLYHHGKSNERDNVHDDSNSTLTLLGSADEEPPAKPVTQTQARRIPKTTAPSQRGLPTTTPAQAATTVEHSPTLSKHISNPSSSSATLATSPPRTSPSPAVTAWRPQPPTRKSVSRMKTAPLASLPGQPDYADYTYYEAAALGRARHIPTGGNTQEIRNRLIQDDTNVAQNKTRERSRYKSAGRTRGYKTVAPLKEAGGQGKDELEGSVDGEKEAESGETERAGRKMGKENIAPGRGNKDDTITDGEVVAKAVEGVRGVKRKGGADGDVQGSDGESQAKKAKT